MRELVKSLRSGPACGVVALCICSAVASLILTTASVAIAKVVTLRFSGTYDTSGGTVFGESGASVPYNYEITYDTTLDTNTEYYASGAPMKPGVTTIHEWYGYSASGIVSASLVFGSKTFLVSSISALIPEIGHSADLWFDTDLAVISPGLSWVYFQDGDGSLVLGGQACDASNCYLDPSSIIHDDVAMNTGTGAMQIDEGGSPIPTLSEWGLITFGMLLLTAMALALRRRQAA